MGQYDSIEISASGMSAERLAMDVIANNLANANTTRTPEGGSFKRQLIVFAQKQEASQAADPFDPIPNDEISSSSSPDPTGGDPNGSRAGVQVVSIVPDTSPDRLVYDPTHPDADAQGYVHMPNIDVVKEMVDMIAASRAYQANVTAIQEARAQGSAALGLLKA
jgi:flagellar basal-body rod protein FlgC